MSTPAESRSPAARAADGLRSLGAALTDGDARVALARAATVTLGRLRSHPVLLGVARGGLFLVLAVVALVLADRLPWYPVRIDFYYRTAVLCAVAVGVGRRAPTLLLLAVGLAVGWPSWWFSVGEVRMIPLALAAWLAASGGLRLLVALPLTALFAVSGLFPQWSWTEPRYLFDGLVYENVSVRVLAFCIVLAAVLLGRASFVQQRDAAALRERNAALERLREADQVRIATEERTAIAREIHDVVTHHVSAMVIRAQGAARVADTRPEELRPTVDWIAASGQEALTAMRNVVRVLRGAEHGGTTEAPMVLADAVDEVVARVRATGLEVVTDVVIPDGLTAIQEFAVLRVCQEALTNVLIHADADRVRVSLTALADDVLLLVEDDGLLAGTTRPVGDRRAGSLGSGGAGIRGMQERAEAVGGRLVAGPVLHGWRVELLLPITAAAADTVPALAGGPVRGDGAARGHGGAAGPVGRTSEAPGHRRTTREARP